MDAWITDELSGAHFGDARLNQRYALLLERLQAKPSLSIPGACKGWAEIQAAYRFFSNSKVNKENILLPHIQTTQGRMQLPCIWSLHGDYFMSEC